MSGELCTQDVFNRLWDHFALRGATPGRGHDGRLSTLYEAGDGHFPAEGTACAVFLAPHQDHSYLIGTPAQQWVMAAKRSVKMGATAGELLAEVEVAVRECAKAAIQDGVLIGEVFTPSVTKRLEAIRVDFRLAAYSAPIIPRP